MTVIVKGELSDSERKMYEEYVKTHYDGDITLLTITVDDFSVDLETQVKTRHLTTMPRLRVSAVDYTHTVSGLLDD